MKKLREFVSFWFPIILLFVVFQTFVLVTFIFGRRDPIEFTPPEHEEEMARLTKFGGWRPR